MEAILAQQATTKANATTFVVDSDLKPFGINNCTSAFISGNINNLVGQIDQLQQNCPWFWKHLQNLRHRDLLRNLPESLQSIATIMQLYLSTHTQEKVRCTCKGHKGQVKQWKQNKH